MEAAGHGARRPPRRRRERRPAVPEPGRQGRVPPPPIAPYNAAGIDAHEDGILRVDSVPSTTKASPERCATSRVRRRLLPRLGNSHDSGNTSKSRRAAPRTLASLGLSGRRVDSEPDDHKWQHGRSVPAESTRCYPESAGRPWRHGAPPPPSTGRSWAHRPRGMNRRARTSAVGA